MFKGVLFVAAALSVIACIAYDIRARVELHDVQRDIEVRQAELAKLSAFDRQVRMFQRQKDDLQHRVDLIDQVKRVETGTSDAVAMLSELGQEASAIQSVSVVGAKKVVVHGRAESEKLIHDAAAKLGLNVTFEAKP